MDMKKILQALDTASTKPVEGASSMAKFLRVVKEADINQAPAIQVPEVPPMPSQDGDQGDGSRLETNPDGTKTYAGAFGTFTYNPQGQAIKYASPNFGGFGQEIDLTNKQTKQSYSQGPLSIQQSKDASGAVTNTNSEYDLGVTKLKHNAGINGVTNSATIPDGGTQHVINEGANPHKVTLPVQMAMQHYSKPAEKTKSRSRLIDKYFTEAQEAIEQRKVEKRELINQYASVIAERVLMKEGVAGPKSCWPGHRKVGTQPGTGKNKGKRVNDCEKIEEDNAPDIISLDIPLFIRLMEFAREDAQTDVDLHNVAEKLISLSSEGNTLTMQNYSSIVGAEEETDLNEGADLTGFNTGYLEKVASGAPGRWMCSPADAKAELARRAGSEDPHTEPPKVTQQPQQSGYSKEYLLKAADPNRFGRYLISVEQAQALLRQMQE